MPVCEAPVTHDLEHLVTLLEVAAISLTNAPGDVFTEDELFTEAQAIAGDGLRVDTRDLKIVVNGLKSVRATPGGYRLA